jgi:hypothetical protein
MAWTYNGSPGTSTAPARLDAVRYFIGDTDTTDQQLQDAEITFCLAQTSDDVYLASSLAASSLAAKYGRLVDVTLDNSNVRASYSQRQKNYVDISRQMEKKAIRYGSKSLGLPDAGGISVAEVLSVENNPDRVAPMFSIDVLSKGNSDVNPI